MVWLGGAWRCLFCTRPRRPVGHALPDPGPTPLGPFTLDRPEFLAADAAGTHYAGRVLEHRGERHFFAWRQHDAHGGVPSATLSDPMERQGQAPPPWVGLP